MMDADFEYGLQGTKWQSYVDIRKFPSFFEIPGSDFVVSNVVSDGGNIASNITVYYSNVFSTPPPVGSFISMFGLTNQRSALADRAEGYFIVSAINATSNSANYIAKSYVPSGNIQSAMTFSRKANVYNSGTLTIPFSSILADGSGNLQVFTSNAHGLLPGFPLVANNFCKGGTGSNAFYGNFFGSFFVSNVTSATSFNIVANTYTFGNVNFTDSNLTSSNCTLYISQFASQQHRPYDGGVLLSTLSPAHGSTVARQSKKAFRYQSGKGILFSSGTLFAPNLDIASVSLSGPTTTVSGVPSFSSPFIIPVNSTANLAVGQTITAGGIQPLQNFANTFTTGAATITAVNQGSITVKYTGTYPTTYVPSYGLNITSNATTTTLGNPLLSGAVNIKTPTSALANGLAIGQTITSFPSSLGTVTLSNVNTANIQVTFTGTWPTGDVPIGTQITTQAVTTALETKLTANTAIFTGSPAGQINLTSVNTLISNGFATGQLVTIGSTNLLGTPLLNAITQINSTLFNLDTSYGLADTLPVAIPSGTLLTNTATSTITNQVQLITPTLTLPISNLTPSANGFIAGQTLSLGPGLSNLGTVTCSNVGYGYIQANFTGTSNLISSNIPAGTWINLASNPVLTFPSATYPGSQVWITGTTINVNYTAGQINNGLFAPGMNLVFSNLTGILTPVNANILAINTIAQNLICYASGSGNLSYINQVITGTLPQGNVASGTFTPPTLSLNATTISNVVTLKVSGSVPNGIGPGQTLLGVSSVLGNCIVSSNTSSSVSVFFTNAYTLDTTLTAGSFSVVPVVTNTWASTALTTSPGTIAVQSTLGFYPGMSLTFGSAGSITSAVVSSVGPNSITFSFSGNGTIAALTSVTGTWTSGTSTGSTFVQAYPNVYIPLTGTTGFTSNMAATTLGFGKLSNVFTGTGIEVGFEQSLQIPTTLSAGTFAATARAITSGAAIFSANANVIVNSNTGFMIDSSAKNNVIISGLSSSFGQVTLSSNATPTNPTVLPLNFSLAGNATLPYTIPSGTLITGVANAVTSSNGIETPGNTFQLQVSSTSGFIPGQTINTFSTTSTLAPFGAMNPVTINAVSATTLTCNFSGTYTTIPTGNTITYQSNGLVMTSNLQPATSSFTLPVNSTSGFSNGQTIASTLLTSLGTATITGVPDTGSLVVGYTGTWPASNGIPLGTTVTVLPTGSNLQVVTDVAHGIPTTGATVTIRNFTTTAINGTGYTITGAIDSHTVNVQTQSALSSTLVNLGDQPRLVVTNWHGSTVRAGTFEDPNGLFWEYDGQTLSVVRRQSTFQCAGYVTVSQKSQTLIGTTVGSAGTFGGLPSSGTAFTTSIGDTSTLLTLPSGATHTIQQYMTTVITGLGQVWVIGQVDAFQIQIGFVPTTSAVSVTWATLTATSWSLPTTRFQDQLQVNDRFTLKGMTYQVTSIQGQGVLTFNPPYRGASNIPASAPVKACKIKELRVPQSQFNRDTIDGKGPSGYKVDLSRQQMIGLQYTWYGAGFVDFMIRGPDGNWIMCHRIKNNNVNDEAYMRSGNLPVRYELSVESRAAVTSLAANMTNSQTTLTVNDPTTFFPPSGGTLLVDNELIYYTGTTTYSFTGCTRAAPLSYVVNDTRRTFTGQAASTHLQGTSVNLISCTATPTMTHWGSSFLTDGQFDIERGYYFNYSNTSVTIGSSPAGASAFAIRLAPSVTNGLVGDIGQKELLNRAQLLLQKLEVTSPNNIVTVGFLNPSNVYFNTNSWLNINTPTTGAQPSFAQYYPGNLILSTPQPGERIFQTIVQGNNQNNLDLGALKEMANSTIGGNQQFPDGPDVLLIYCQNLSTVPVTAQVNLFWSEAQA